MKAEDYIEQYCQDNLKEEDWIGLEKYREAFKKMYLKEAIFIKNFNYKKTKRKRNIT